MAAIALCRGDGFQHLFQAASPHSMDKCLERQRRRPTTVVELPPADFCAFRVETPAKTNDS